MKKFLCTETKVAKSKNFEQNSEYCKINSKNTTIDDYNFFFEKPGVFAGQKSSYSADLLKMI